MTTVYDSYFNKNKLKYLPIVFFKPRDSMRLSYKLRKKVFSLL